MLVPIFEKNFEYTLHPLQNYKVNFTYLYTLTYT